MQAVEVTMSELRIIEKTSGGGDGGSGDDDHCGRGDYRGLSW